MKLNHNCVRDILIFCEDSPSFDENLEYVHLYLSDFCQNLPQYSKEEIAYTLIILDEAGLILSNPLRYDGGIADITYTRLTYQGHEFIDTIRSEKVWNKIKKTISAVGSVSLPVLQEIGSQILLSVLSGHQSA